MAKLVVFYINDKEGDFNRGFPVSLRIREDDRMIGQKVDAFLPANSYLLEHYRLWQSGYISLVSSLYSSRQVKARKATNVSTAEIIAASDRLKFSVNDWLNSAELMPIIHKLDEKLSKTDDILFVFNTKNIDLQRLPWHFWDFFDSYRKAEVALSFPVSQRKLLTAKGKVKILAVFGDNQTSGDITSIEIDKDWELLQKHLIDAEFFTPLRQPTLEELHDQLWQTTPDILYYGGHSSIEKDGTTTTFNIRHDEKIQINDFIKALKKAGERGLQLAIFNSCEGLGIARQLADCSIPQVIVMREAVPDEVARKFLGYFLREFANGKPLYLAVREARESMGYLEKKYPGATWLPMIFQNPAELPYTWRQIRGITSTNKFNQTQQVNEGFKTGNQSENKQSKNVNVPPKIYCSNCGVVNPINARFCSQCAHSLLNTKQQSVSTKEINNQTVGMIPVPCPPPNLTLVSIKSSTSSISPVLQGQENTKFSLNSNSWLKNRYRVMKTLGAGGFGKTFLAEDTQMPSLRKCVIKQLKASGNDPQFYQLLQERFQREAAILEELGDDCPQIPTLYAYFAENGEFYLVQEYVQGPTLEEISRQGLLNESIVQEILINILPVLDYIHSRKILHRDIKPQNILIRYSDSKPVLIDFGAVKEIMGTVNSGESPSTSIIIGTAGFMPMEQAAGRPQFSSDIYSLGLTAIYLLTGKRPQELENDAFTGEIIWRRFASGITPAFADILDKSIQSAARDRYATANEMLEAIKDL